MKEKRTCGNCVQCVKHDAFWSCENSFESVGMPVKCSPPYDEACPNWTDNPADIDKPSDRLRDFVDHFWDGDA